MARIEKLHGEPDHDPRDLSNAPFAFGRLPTGREMAAAQSPCPPHQHQPPDQLRGPVVLGPFSTDEYLAVAARVLGMSQQYQPPDQLPTGEELATVDHVEDISHQYQPPRRHSEPVTSPDMRRSVALHLHIRLETQEAPSTTAGDDVIPTRSESRNTADMRCVTPPPEPEFPPDAEPPVLSVADFRRRYICLETWREVHSENLGWATPDSRADEDAAADEVMNLVNTIHEVVISESTPSPLSYRDLFGRIPTMPVPDEEYWEWM